MINPTTIIADDQIYLTGAPINLRIQNLAKSSSIKTVVLELYIWSGNLNAPPTLPNYTLIADKLSAEDDYINFQIAEILSSHINKTRFEFEDIPTTLGEGVFFQYKTFVDTEASSQGVTNFATNGYRLDFEQIGDNVKKQPYAGLIPINYDRKYTASIKYFKRNFDFTKTLADCTSENIIKSTKNVPKNTVCQTGEKFLVAYINRLGLWDYFTPYGKIVKMVKIDSETTPRLYRNPNSINNSINHSRRRTIDTTEQSYTINTGDLNEYMVEQIEEVIYSPLIYLIEILGESLPPISKSITADSTLITADSTLIRADNDYIHITNFKQIPVTNDNKDFVRKTRLNEKTKINYELIFNATVGRINNLK